MSPKPPNTSTTFPGNACIDVEGWYCNLGIGEKLKEVLTNKTRMVTRKGVFIISISLRYPNGDGFRRVRTLNMLIYWIRGLFVDGAVKLQIQNKTCATRTH